jgi:hypothetical protein
VQSAPGEPSFGSIIVVHGREDGRIGPHLAQLEEDPFRAAQIEQEVVHQRDRALGLCTVRLSQGRQSMRDRAAGIA